MSAMALARMPDLEFWTHARVIGLAKVSCAACHGSGLRTLPRFMKRRPCGCVLRAIFRACYNRYRDCLANAAQMTTVSLDYCPGEDGRRMYSRKKEEYSADFYLVSRRTLDAAEFRIFRWHFLLGADWKLCCRQLGIDRGNFFHAVYRIEQRLGQVFAELQPYALYPLDEYFGGTLGKKIERKRKAA